MPGPGLTDEEMFAMPAADPTAPMPGYHRVAQGAVSIDLPDHTPQAQAPQGAVVAPPQAPAPQGLTDEEMFAPHTQPGLIGGITGAMANVNRGLGVGDEMAGGLKAIRDIATGNSGPNWIQTFKDEMANQRATEDGFSVDHPHLAALGRGMGMMIPALGGGPAAAELASGRLAALGAGAANGAVAAAGYSLADRGSPMERVQAANRAMPFGLGLGMAGGALAPVAGKISPDAASLADHVTTGVDPLPAVVGTSDMQKIGQILKGIPIVGQPLVAAADRTAHQLDTGIQGLAARLGAGTDPLSSGSALQRGAEGAVGRYQDTTHHLYAPVNAMEANPQVVPLAQTKAALDDMFAKYPNIPDWLAKNAPQLANVKKTLDGAPQVNGAPGLTFGELKGMRSDIGQMVKDHLTVGNIDQARLKSLYGAMSDDMMGGAGQLGGSEAQAALSRADTYNAAKASRISDVLDKVIQAKSPEEAYGKVLAMAGSSSRADQTQLGQLKRSLDPQAWNDFAGGVINQMGRDPNSGFSAAKFVTAWTKMTPGAKQSLFGETAPDLDAFARVAQQQGAAGKFYNHSGSGSHMISAMLVADPAIEAMRSLMEGKAAEAAQTVIAPAVAGIAGNVTARVLANPGFGRAMLAAAQTPASAGRIMEDYAAKNPAIASSVRQLGQRLQQNLSTGVAGVGASVPNQQSR